MPTTCHTARFGELEIPDEHLLELPDGLIGIPGERYALLRVGDGPFVWLQSLELPEFAVPLCDICEALADPPLQLSPEDLERTGAGGDEPARVWVTVRAMPGGACTVNLRAPIVHVGARAWQVINQAPDADLRRPLASRRSVAA